MDVPVVLGAGLDLVPLALFQPLTLALLFRLGLREGHGCLLPGLLHGMPPCRANLGRQVVGAKELAHHAAGLVGLLLCAGVEKDLRAVTGHDHTAPEPLPRFVVAIERPQPLAEGVAVLLVVQLHLDAPVLVGHRTMISAPSPTLDR